jgi:hypothetical protein
MAAQHLGESFRADRRRRRFAWLLDPAALACLPPLGGIEQRAHPGGGRIRLLRHFVRQTARETALHAQQQFHALQAAKTEVAVKGCTKRDLFRGLRRADLG